MGLTAFMVTWMSDTIRITGTMAPSLLAEKNPSMASMAMWPTMVMGMKETQAMTVAGNIPPASPAADTPVGAGIRVGADTTKDGSTRLCIFRGASNQLAPFDFLAWLG